MNFRILILTILFTTSSLLAQKSKAQSHGNNDWSETKRLEWIKTTSQSLGKYQPEKGENGQRLKTRIHEGKLLQSYRNQDGKLYSHEGHVCGNISHYEAIGLDTVKTSRDFFKFFKDDTEKKSWKEQK